MEAGVTLITVNDLVRVGVQPTKTNLAVGILPLLFRLLIHRELALRPGLAYVLLVRFDHSLCFLKKAFFKRPKDSDPS